MPKFASTGLLAVTGGLAGLGAGLATAARDYGQYAANKDLQNDRHAFEMQKVALADKLAGVRAAEDRDFRASESSLDRSSKLTQIDMQQAGDRMNIGLQGNIDLRKQGISERGLDTRLEKTLGAGSQEKDKELGFEREKLAANIESDKAKIGLGEKQIAYSYDADMKRLDAAKSLKEMEIEAQSILQQQINDQRTDEQIRQFAQESAMENTKAKNALIQISLQATEQRENIRTEYGFREEMQQHEIYSNETQAFAERVLKRELGQLQAGTELTKTGMVLAADKYIAQLKAGAGEKDAKLNEKLVAALLVSMNDLQKKVNDGEATDGEIAVLRQRERTFQAVTGVNIRDTQNLDLSAFDAPATEPGEPTQPAPTQESKGFGFLDSLRSVLPGQQGAAATGLLNRQP